MIKTTVIALIEGRRYEFTAELAETAGWADTANETAIGLLHDSMDQLAKAIERDTESDEFPVLRNCAAGGHLDCFRPEVCGCACHRTRVALVDENGNRQCYLCGFYHDEPGSCANGTPTNVTPGPDDEPEYDGPTMDYGEYIDDAEETPDEDDDSYHGPEEGDYRESTFPTLDEILETGRPYCGDDELVVAVDPAMHHDSKIPPLIASLRAYRDGVAKAVVEASKPAPKITVQCGEDKHWRCPPSVVCGCDCHAASTVKVDQ